MFRASKGEFRLLFDRATWKDFQSELSKEHLTFFQSFPQATKEESRTASKPPVLVPQMKSKHCQGLGVKSRLVCIRT